MNQSKKGQNFVSQLTVKSLNNSSSEQTKTGFKFGNFLGAVANFCLSHPDLDHNLDFQDINRSQSVKLQQRIFDTYFTNERIIKVPASIHNSALEKVTVSKDHMFFQNQKQIIEERENRKIQDGKQEIRLNDKIEEEPITIDLKIEGIKKISKIPIENVGVFSFFADVEEPETVVNNTSNSHKLFNMFRDTNAPKQVGVLVNINTKGKQRIINFESQLLFQNNLSEEVVLVFKMIKINRFARKISNIGQNSKKRASKNTFKDKKVKRRKSQKGKTEKVELSKRKFSSPNQKQVKFSKDEKQVNLSTGIMLSGIKPKIDLLQVGKDEDDSISDCDSNQSYEFKSPRASLAFEQKEDEIEVVIQQNDIFKVPLMFLMPDSNIDVFIKLKPCVDGDNHEIPQEGQIKLFSNISNIFDENGEQAERNSGPGKTESYKIKSQIVELNEDLYASIDVQGFTCFPKQHQEKNPVQYIVNINPPLVLANYNLMPLEIFEIDRDHFLHEKQPKSVSRIAPSRTDKIFELNLREDNQSRFMLQFHDLDFKMLLTQIVDDFDNKTIEKGLMFKRHSHELNDLEEIKKCKDLCHMKIEKSKMAFQDVKAYQQDFSLRQQVVTVQKSIKLTVYPQFCIVNKTSKNIRIKEQVIEAKTNQMLWNAQETKIKVVVDDDPSQKSFYMSESIDIKTIGLNGQINLVHSLKTVFDQFQFGISISQGSFPYNNTTIVTIVPRYLLVNKLEHPVLVKQYFQSKDSKRMTVKNEIIVSNLNEEHQKEFHFKKDDNKKKVRKITFGALHDNPNSANFESNRGENLISRRSKNEESELCLPFSVDDIQDFQTEFDIPEEMKIGKEVDSDEDEIKKENWFYPSHKTNNKLISRVMITENPSDKNATILIIFDEPLVPEYTIQNSTDSIISFRKYDWRLRSPISGWIQLKPKEVMFFVWDVRDQNQKYIQLYIGSQELEFCILEMNKRIDLIQQNNIIYSSMLTFDQKNNQTQILEINQREKTAFSLKNIMSNKFSKKSNEDEEDQNGVNYNGQTTYEEDEEEENDKKSGMKLIINFNGFGMSLIDSEPRELLFICLNQVMLTYQYVTLTKDNGESNTRTIVEFSIENFQIDNLIDEEFPVLFGQQSYYNKHLIVANMANSMSDLSNFYKIVEESEMRSKRKKRQIQNAPFVVFQVIMTQQNHENKLGTLLRYEKIKFGFQKFFIQIESKILERMTKMFSDISLIFYAEVSEDVLTTKAEYEESLNRNRGHESSMVDASLGVVVDEKSIQVDKVSFGFLQILALDISISIRLEIQGIKIDLSNPRQFFGLMNIVKPFISQLASITDAKIKFNEIGIREGFTSQNQIINNLYNQYFNQGLVQVYKILGSSNIIGNPVGFAEKAGASFYEFFREPYLGLQESPEAFFLGVSTGVQGVVGGVIGGGFENLGLMTGSMYNVVKMTAGNNIKRRDHADNIAQGVYYAIKGLGVEVYDGLTGIVWKPIQGAKAEGLRGFSRGFGEGLLGAVSTPVTGVLRAGQSMSEGISGSANWIGNYGKAKLEQLNVKQVRIRPIRRIDQRGQVRIYNEDLAIINKLLACTVVKKTQIRFFAMLPTLDGAGNVIQNQKSLILITNEHLMFYRVQNFLDMQHDKYVSKSLMMSEKLSNVYSYKVQKSPSYHHVDKNNSDKKTYEPPMYFLKMTFRKYFHQEEKISHGRSDSEGGSPGGVMTQNRDHRNSETSAFKQKNMVNEMKDMSLMRDTGIQQKRKGIVIKGNDGGQGAHEHDQRNKFKYVFFSPSLEIFSRMDQILCTIPEIQRNLGEVDKERNKRQERQDKMKAKKVMAAQLTKEISNNYKEKIRKMSLTLERSDNEKQEIVQMQKKVEKLTKFEQ